MFLFSNSISDNFYTIFYDKWLSDHLNMRFIGEGNFLFLLSILPTYYAY